MFCQWLSDVTHTARGNDTLTRFLRDGALLLAKIERAENNFTLKTYYPPNDQHLVISSPSGDQSFMFTSAEDCLFKRVRY